MSADLAQISIPAECRETIRTGALVAISRSGGKHSQAMTILLSRIVPSDRLVAVHAPLAQVEWPGTLSPSGVPLPALTGIPAPRPTFAVDTPPLA